LRRIAGVRDVTARLWAASVRTKDKYTFNNDFVYRLRIAMATNREDKNMWSGTRIGNKIGSESFGPRSGD
jgi:hypothetical protein